MAREIDSEDRLSADGWNMSMSTIDTEEEERSQRGLLIKARSETIRGFESKPGRGLKKGSAACRWKQWKQRTDRVNEEDGVDRIDRLTKEED